MDACPICGKRVKLDQSRVCHRRFGFRPAHLECYYAQRSDEDTSHNSKEMEEIKLEGEPETPVEPTPTEPTPSTEPTPAEETPAETPVEPAPEDPGDVGETGPAKEPDTDEENIEDPAGV